MDLNAIISAAITAAIDAKLEPLTNRIGTLESITERYLVAMVPPNVAAEPSIETRITALEVLFKTATVPTMVPVAEPGVFTPLGDVSFNMIHLDERINTLHRALGRLIDLSAETEDFPTLKLEFTERLLSAVDSTLDDLSERISNDIKDSYDTHAFRSAVEDALDGSTTLDDKIESKFEDHDFEDQIESAIEDFDFEEKIKDAVGDVIRSEVKTVLKDVTFQVTADLY